VELAAPNNVIVATTAEWLLLRGPLGWRDRRFQGLIAAWLLFNAVCLGLGLFAANSEWIKVPLPLLGRGAYVTVYPPAYLCQIALFVLGFE
jgi:hypothetical protein